MKKYFVIATHWDEERKAQVKYIAGAFNDFPKDFQYITVKEICQRAGVHRSTFYLHYETVNDLLEESIQQMHGQFQASFESRTVDIVQQIRECPIEDLYLVTPAYLTPYLEFVRAHKKVFLAATKMAGPFRTQETYAHMFREVFEPIMDRFRIPTRNQAFLMEFYVHGLQAVVLKWIENDCEEPLEQISAVMVQCVRGGTQ